MIEYLIGINRTKRPGDNTLASRLRREESCELRVRDLAEWEGVLHLRVEGKGEKIRFLVLAARAERLIKAYLDQTGHRNDLNGPLFRPVKNNKTGTLHKPPHPDSVYRLVAHYGAQVGITEAVHGFSPTLAVRYYTRQRRGISEAAVQG